MAKTILITGGAGGICSEISRGLAADGLNVVVAERQGRSGQGCR